MPKEYLAQYCSNVFSQAGEDGIINKIFEIIGVESKLAVEFGAWDGFHFSNTAALWGQDYTWKGVLIEGDLERFKELKRNTSLFNVLALQEWVGVGPHDCLEAILSRAGITQTIDILSIDIDGNDYHIFVSLDTIRPRLIVCEYNPTIPVWYDIYGPYSKDNNIGQSVGALNRIAATKGYRLVALTQVNAFYVREKDFEKFADFETDLAKITINDGYITLITTYDGKYALVKNKTENYFYGIHEQYEGALRGDCMRIDTDKNMPAGIFNVAGLYQKT